MRGSERNYPAVRFLSDGINSRVDSGNPQTAGGRIANARIPDASPPPRSGGLPATLRALHHRNFRLFFSGQLISLIGTWMQTVAESWLVLSSDWLFAEAGGDGFRQPDSGLPVRPTRRHRR